MKLLMRLYFFSFDISSTYKYMKSLQILAFAVLALLSCSTTQTPTPSAVGLVNRPHYTVKESASLPPGDHFMVIANNDTFSNLFSASTTEGERENPPGFSGQTVLAIILKPTEKKTTIQLTRAEIAGNHLNAYYTVQEEGTALPTLQRPTAVATVPRSLSVKKVNFYAHGSLVKSVPVVF